jgi:serine/threonine protein phosphatase PrpC
VKIETVYHQGSGRLNEDSLFYEKNLFAVFDGASSLTNRLYADKTGAWLASHIARKNCSPNRSPLQNLLQANNALQAAMISENVNMADPLELWSASAAALQIHKNHIEWAQIGDSMVATITNDGAVHFPAPYHNHDAQTLAFWKKMAETGEKNIYEKIKPVIKKVRCGMNRYYGALNGKPEVKPFLNTGRIPRKDIKHLLLFTDGLHIPVKTNRTQENIAEVCKEYLKKGLQGVYDTVRTLEKTDPLCLQYPRFKCHDDIAAIAITLP